MKPLCFIRFRMNAELSLLLVLRYESSLQRKSNDCCIIVYGRDGVFLPYLFGRDRAKSSFSNWNIIILFYHYLVTMIDLHKSYQFYLISLITRAGAM